MPKIPDHSYRVLIIGGSGSGRKNALLYLTSHQPDTDRIYLYVKELYGTIFHLLVNKRKFWLKHYNNSNTFIEYSDDMDDI